MHAELEQTSAPKNIRRIRREQFRQAKQIHGGLVNLLGAALAIKLSRLPIPGRRLRLSVYRGAFARAFSCSSNPCLRSTPQR